MGRELVRGENGQKVISKLGRELEEKKTGRELEQKKYKTMNKSG